MEIIKHISNWQTIRDHIANTRDASATPEKSHCARGRDQYWLQYEPNYNSGKYTAAITDPRLWDWIKKQIPQADLAQVIFGNRGIDWHRDAAYAHATAYLLSLGTSTFETEIEGKIQSIDLNGGELIRFNCKNKHRAINVAPNRIAIGIWQAKIALPTT